MKKIVLMLLLMFCTSVFALDTYHSVSTVVPNGRYEIIQSPLARKYTIKIDKETGDTWQMVTDSRDNNTWEKLYREHDSFGQKKPNSINFQIFMGGIAAADMFLINVNSGETWQLCRDSKIGNFWAYMP